MQCRERGEKSSGRAAVLLAFDQKKAMEMADTSIMDRAYSNGAFIPGAEGFPPRWAMQAAAFRASLGSRARLDLPYGTGARQAFDLFLPEGTAQGLMVFIHGGYWKAFDRNLWSHLAAGALTRGWACAMPSYTLAPEARIAAMTAEIAQAIRSASAMVAGPVVVAGHSAGGHLAARMACTDQTVPVARVVPISPVADLAPLMGAEMNQTLHIDAAEVVRESPALLPQRPDVQAHVWVGGQERPAFLWQARSLSENWGCPWTVASDKHHFDVIDDLGDANSALMQACLHTV
jgi:arylformamidase